MTNLGKAYRADLAERFVIEIPRGGAPRRFGRRHAQVPFGADRRRPRGGRVVYIPEEDRGTLCISSQVGCTLTCSFCHTPARRKLVAPTSHRGRDHRPGDAGARTIWANGPRHGEGMGPAGPRLVSNLVLMGHGGEPTLQFRQNVRGCDEDRDGWQGISLSAAGRITPVDLGRGARDRAAPPTRSGCMLAVSFHATTDEVRDRAGADQTGAGTSPSCSRALRA